MTGRNGGFTSLVDREKVETAGTVIASLDLHPTPSNVTLPDQPPPQITHAQISALVDRDLISVRITRSGIKIPGVNAKARLDRILN